MTKRFNELFEQWKEMHHASIPRWENWYTQLSFEDQQIIDSWGAVYNYGYNTGYNDHKK